MTDNEVVLHNIQFMKYRPSLIQRLAFDDKSNLLAVARSDNSVELWNCLHQPFRQKILPSDQTGGGCIEALLWCRGRLYSGNLNGNITEHDLHSSGEQQDQRGRHVTVTGGACWSLAANAQETLIAAGTEGGYVSLLSVTDSGLHNDRILEMLTGRVMSLSWLQSGTHLVASTRNHLHICSVATRQPVSSIRAFTRNKKEAPMLLCIAVLPDFTIVAGDSRGVVTFWSGSTTAQISAVTSHKAAVLALAVRGTTVYAAGVDPSIRLLQRGSDGRWNKSHMVEVHSHDVRGLAVDGKGRVYSGGVDTTLGVHFFPPKTVYHLPQSPPSGAVSVAGESLLLCGTDSVEWWRMGRQRGRGEERQDRTLVAAMACKEQRPLCCALSTSATRAAYVTKRRGLRLWRLQGPKGSSKLTLSKIPVQDSTGSTPTRLLWLTDDCLVVVVAGGDIQLWTVSDSAATLSRHLPRYTPSTTDSLLQSQAADEELQHLASSSCGGLLLTATTERCLVYDVATGVATRMPSHPAAITAACVRSSSSSSSSSSSNSPPSTVSGTALLAYSDNTLREYDVQTATITEFGEKIATVYSNPNNRHVVRGISWDTKGDVLCLHDDTKMVFLNKSNVMKYDWDSVPATKRKLECVVNGVVKVNGCGDGNNGLNKLIKRVRQQPSVDPLVDVWSSLTSRVQRQSGYIMHAQQSDGPMVACIEMLFDTVRSELPKPLRVDKFGTK